MAAVAAEGGSIPDPELGELARTLNETVAAHLPSSIDWRSLDDVNRTEAAKLGAANCIRRMALDAPGDLITEGKLVNVVSDLLDSIGQGRHAFSLLALHDYVLAGLVVPHAWVLRDRGPVGGPGGGAQLRFGRDGVLQRVACDPRDPLAGYRRHGLVLAGDVVPPRPAVALYRFAQAWEVIGVRDRWRRGAAESGRVARAKVRAYGAKQADKARRKAENARALGEGNWRDIARQFDMLADYDNHGEEAAHVARCKLGLDPRKPSTEDVYKALAEKYGRFQWKYVRKRTAPYRTFAVKHRREVAR